MERLEDLAVVEQGGIFILHDGLEAKLCLLPNQDVHLLASLVGRAVFGEELIHLGRSHETETLIVLVAIHDVTLTLHHTHLLLTEGHEKVFHQPPIQESTILVHPAHLQIAELSHLYQRGLRGSHQSFLIVQIEKHIQQVSLLSAFGDVALW